MTAALLVASLLYRPCILSAVAWAESLDSWTAVAGSHRGPYQIAVRHSRLPWWALHVEPVARLEAWRMLTWWHRRAGDWHGAQAIGTVRCVGIGTATPACGVSAGSSTQPPCCGGVEV